MSSVFLALCWKEYRELKWNVVAMLAIVLSLPVYAFVRERETAFFWVLIIFAIYAVIGGICFGMWAAAGERANRSAAFLDALPVSPKTLGAMKLLFTLIAALIPMVCLMACGFAFRDAAEPILRRQDHFWILATIYVACMIHVTLTTSTFGTGQRSELLAAGRGLLVFAVWGAATFLAMFFTVNTDNRWSAGLLFLGPPLYLLGGEFEWRAIPWEFVLGLCGTGLVMIVLAVMFVVRYSSAIKPLVSRTRNRTWTLSLPRTAGTLGTLAWKQFNECLSMVLIVLGIALLLGSVICLGNIVLGFRDHPPQMLVTRRDIVSWTMPGLVLFTLLAVLGGFILSLLLGVSAFAADLDPRVNTFWRSRPICPTQWFWSKYLIALGSLVLAIGFPALICFALIEVSSTGSGIPGHELQIVLFIAVGWFGIFSAAVVSTCIVRRPLHSGLLALGLAAGGLALAQWLDEGWFGAEPLKRPLLIAGVWLLASLAATLTAWWAAVRDVVAFE